MRTKNSIRNIVVSAISNIVGILFGFVSQKIFLHTLGIEYLGLNGLFTNIISMLGIVELGLSSAIIYHLYKPIADQDEEKINALMYFYKIGYRIIAVIVFFLSLLILPFLNQIVGPTSIEANITLVFFFFVIDIVCSYLLTYKRSIIYAAQKNYLVYLVHIGYLIVMNGIQIAILLLTKNYYLYLGIKIVMRVLENIILTLVANKLFPVLRKKTNMTLDKKTKKDIFVKIKSLFYHKFGNFVVTGTDNILISIFLGVKQVGFYSNYSMILSAIINLNSQIFSSITSTIGNLIVTAKQNKIFEVFKNIRFANSWAATFISCCFLVLADSIIKVWVGENYVVSFFVVITLSLNLYLQLLRFGVNAFKEAGGIFYEDRYIPIIEAVLNLILSIILLQIFGLAGVFLGTILSTLFVHIYSYPKYVYKKLLGKEYSYAILEFISYFMIHMIVCFATYISASYLVSSNIFLELLIKGIYCLFFPNLLLFLFHFKKEEYNYFKRLILDICTKYRKKKIN